MDSTWMPYLFERPSTGCESGAIGTGRRSDQVVAPELLQPNRAGNGDGINDELIVSSTQLYTPAVPQFMEQSWSTFSNKSGNPPAGLHIAAYDSILDLDDHTFGAYHTEQPENRQPRLEAGWGFIGSYQTEVDPNEDELDTVNAEHPYHMKPGLIIPSLYSEFHPSRSTSGKNDGVSFETDLGHPSLYQLEPEPVSGVQMPMTFRDVQSDSASPHPWSHWFSRTANEGSSYRPQSIRGYEFAQPYSRQNQYVLALSEYSNHLPDSIDSISSTNSADSGYWSRCQSTTAASSISPMCSDTASSVSVRVSKMKRSRTSRRKRDGFTPESSNPGEGSGSIAESSFESANEKDINTPCDENTTKDRLSLRLEAYAPGRSEAPKVVKGHDGDFEHGKCSEGLQRSFRDQQVKVAAILPGSRRTEVKGIEDGTTHLLEHDVATSSSSDDCNDYHAAFESFGLWQALERAEDADIDLTSGPADGDDYSNGGSNTGGSLSSNISSATSFQSGSTPATNTSAPTIGSGHSDRSGVRVATDITLGSTLKKKTSNNHRLSVPCARCGLIFPDDAQAAEHETIMKSNSPCPTWGAEEVSKRNAFFEPGGITQKTNAQIAKAVKDFKGSKSKPSRLPEHCDREHFTTWVASKVPLYIGGSNTSREVAMRELSLWYTYFCTLFPGERIPNNPFAVSSEHKYRRLLDLLKLRLVEAADNQLMQRFTPQEDAAFADLFNDATDALELEMIEEQSRKESNKGTSRKRRRLDDGSAASPSTPAPHITDEAKQRYQSWAFTTPTPSSAMGPPQSPAFPDYTTPGVPPRTPAVSYIAPHACVALDAFQQQSDELEDYLNWPEP